jgi:hypothetical protein
MNDEQLMRLLDVHEAAEVLESIPSADPNPGMTRCGTPAILKRSRAAFCPADFRVLALFPIFTPINRGSEEAQSKRAYGDSALPR